jgi:hypothetical protein
MANNLITLAEYKVYAGINSTDKDNATNLLITKVSELVKNICRRTFIDYVDEYKVDVFKTAVNNHIYLPETPLLSISSVEYSEDFGKSYITLTEFEHYVLDVQTDSIELIAYPYIDYNKVNAFKITYNAGYESIPEDLKLAVFDLVKYYQHNEASVRSHKAVGANTVQIEYILNTKLPAHIHRVLDLYTAYYS